MFGNLLKLINSFGWFRMFGNLGSAVTPSKYSRGKVKSKGKYKGDNPKYDLVESFGNGKGLFRRRQDGQLVTASIKKPALVDKNNKVRSQGGRMSSSAFHHFFLRNSDWYK